MRNRIAKYGDGSPHAEVVGIGIGTREESGIWELEEFHEIENVTDRVKSSHYISHPNFVKVMMKTRHFNKNAENDLVTIFHTHPHHLPIPSITDINFAPFRSIYIIYSPALNDMRAYYWDGNEEGREWAPTTISIKD